MARINIYTSPDERNTDGPKLAGWFDDSKAEWFKENTVWDGNNTVGIMSGIPVSVGYEGLNRTAKGRWVREHNARNYHNGPHDYEFLTDEQARDWLLRNGSDDVVEQYFGEIEDERGPGRPEIGPAFPVRFPQELLTRLDDAAKAEGISRAEKLRRLADAGLTA